jgi:PleD family two-component response regulator
LPATVSAGIATFTAPFPSLETIMHQADALLYEAKAHASARRGPRSERNAS